MKPVIYMLGLLFLAACSTSSKPELTHLPQGWTLLESVTEGENDLNIAYQKYRLPNGLTLILYPNDDAPLVHVDMSYHVGSSREEIGKSGFAHFFEHMMFQGSKHVGDQEHFRIVNEAGGSLNGSTNKDRTNYYQTVPANQLEKVLWLEADRMGFLLEAVSQKKFEVQRHTVKNERAQRVDNAPYGLMSEQMDEALYPREHPYSWQPIGYVEDLDRVDVNDLKDFFLRWYGPNNAVLTIGGDINQQQTVAWVERYFSSIPQGPKVERLAPQPAQLSESRHISLEDRIHIPVLYIAYPTVAMNQQDEVALDMFSEALGGNKSALLHQNLVETGQALSASSSHYCRELACTLSIYVRANPNGDLTLADLERMVDQSIQQFSEQGISQQQLELVRSSLRASAIYSLDNVSDVVSQLSFGELFLEKPLFVEDLLAQYQAVDEEQVMQAFQHYINGKNRVVMSVVPHGKTNLLAAPDDYQVAARALGKQDSTDNAASVLRPVKDDFDRSVEPSGGPAPVVALPQLWDSKLSNGLTILGTSDHKNATITLNFRMPGGSASERTEQYGIARFTAKMLMQSTIDNNVATLSDQLEALGASINFDSGLYSQNIEVSSLSENLSQVLNILEQRLLQPAFDPKEFEREKARYIQGIEQRFQGPSWQANMATQKLIYGEQSRLASSSWGSVASISSLTLADVKDFWQRYYLPSKAQLVVVGDLSQVELESKLLDLSQSWQGEGPDFPHLVEYDAASPASIYFIDQPGAVQSELRLARPALPFDAADAYFTAKLMNFNFGGNFNSRINMNLREDKAYTYGVNSSFSGFKDLGRFTISTSVRRDATADAITELLSELKTYQASGPNESELNYMRNAVSQQEALAYASPQQKAGFLMQMLSYDLQPEFVAQQAEVVNRVTQAELASVAEQYFVGEEMLVVVVGDKATVKPQLELLGWPVVELTP